MTSFPLSRTVKDAVETLVLALILTLVIRGFLMESFLVQGHSMEPTLHHGERLLVSKLLYRFREPERGEIVVFRYPRDNRTDFIKRVLALPGDKVEIRLGRLYINDQPVEEPYVYHAGMFTMPPLVVPEGQVFVLGDNRTNSEDSRVFGPVDLENVKGKAFVVFWPLPRIHVLGVGVTGDERWLVSVAGSLFASRTLPGFAAGNSHGGVSP
jgi:signal peptidase I